MRALLIWTILIIPLFGFSQSDEDDELTFQSAIEWLDRKLNYIYFDEVSQKWWLNKFYVNEKKEVTVKNIFTNKPRSANIKEKVYLIRKFDIKTINPYNIEIREVYSNQGRIVKGKVLELTTFAHQRSVHNTVDGRRGSDVSFVQISFPSFMTDSIADYAELVQSKFKEAIIASTKVYAVDNVEENKNKILNIMQGKFSSDNDEAITATKKYSNVISIDLGTESQNYFGFSPSDSLFYFSTISDQGSATKNYQLVQTEKLILRNVKDSSDFIEFTTLNSFRLEGKVYYRE